METEQYITGYQHPPGRFDVHEYVFDYPESELARTLIHEEAHLMGQGHPEAYDTENTWYSG